MHNFETFSSRCSPLSKWCGSYGLSQPSGDCVQGYDCNPGSASPFGFQPAPPEAGHAMCTRCVKILVHEIHIHHFCSFCISDTGSTLFFNSNAFSIGASSFASNSSGFVFEPQSLILAQPNATRPFWRSLDVYASGLPSSGAAQTFVIDSNQVISGEWVQFNFAQAMLLSEIWMTPLNSANEPLNAVCVGSQDGISFYSIGDWLDISSFSLSGSARIVSFASGRAVWPTPWRFIRMIFTRLSAGAPRLELQTIQIVALQASVVNLTSVFSLRCNPGFFANVSAVACQMCPAGTYTINPIGQTTCTTCSPGTLFLNA